MFVIKASTPEAMRNEIVKWLNQQASNHRIAAAKTAGINKKMIELARATTYEGAAKFLENCTVEVPNLTILLGTEPSPNNNGG